MSISGQLILILFIGYCYSWNKAVVGIQLVNKFIKGLGWFRNVKNNKFLLRTLNNSSFAGCPKDLTLKVKT